MDNNNGSIRKLARLSQRLNLWLLFALLLSLLLLGVCYWALNRVLDEERDKIDIHFARLMGDIREHESFLLKLVRREHDEALKRDKESVPLQLSQVSQDGTAVVYEGREFSFSLPFSLGTHNRTIPSQGTPGPFALGIMFANFYANFWSQSSYAAPQVLLFDLSRGTSLAIPAMGSVPSQGSQARDSFLKVIARAAKRVSERHLVVPPLQVQWVHADNYYGDSLALLGYILDELPTHLWWPESTQREVVVASLLDIERVNEYEKALARPLFDELTLFSPAGERLLGPPRAANLDSGVNFTVHGLLFKLSSQPVGGWVAIYAIDYPLFLRNIEWLLLVLAILFFGCLSAGWLAQRWYTRHVVSPASQAHRQLVESDAFSRTMIHVAPVAMCMLGCGGCQVVLHNKLAEEWLGDEADILDLLGSLQLFESSNSQSEICVRVGERYLQAAFAPTHYRGEVGLLCVFKDISAHRDAQNALAKAKQAADSANKAKTLFLASMSHEIRTPLYGVLGTLELLALTPLNAQQRGYLQTIQGSSTTLLQLISDILDVSKIEAGQMPLVPEDFCPLELAESVVDGLAASAMAKGLQLYTCIDPIVPRVLHGDSARIRQVLTNLVSNALKFTDFGRVVLRLKVLDHDGDKVHLQWQVTDTGIGIPESAQPHLFEAFYQVDNDRQWISGTGLGLSICWRLTQLMGGQLRVVSEPGLGSSFSLMLALPEGSAGESTLEEVSLHSLSVYMRSPLRELAACLEGWLSRWGAQVLLAEPPSEEQPASVLLEILPDLESSFHWSGPRVQAMAGKPSQPQREEGIWRVSLLSLRGIASALANAHCGELQALAITTESPQLSALGLRILVAEDNPVNQALLREQLEELGCKVRLANDGNEALKQFETDAFDLLLTDLNMPRMNGYQLVTELRQRGVTIPVVGVTANAMREEGERCRSVGMDAWLVKPLSLQGLHDTLCRLVPPQVASVLTPEQEKERLEVPERMRVLFLETMQSDLREAARALHAADPQALCQAIHRMAGALAAVRGNSLVRTCRLMEEGLTSGNVEAGDPRLQRLIERIGAALQGI